MRAIVVVAAVLVSLVGCTRYDPKITAPAEHMPGNALVLMEAAVLTPAGYPPADARWRCFSEAQPNEAKAFWIYGSKGKVQAFSIPAGVCWLIMSWDQGVIIWEDHGTDPRYSFSVRPGEVVYVGKIGYSFFHNPYDPDVPDWLPTSNATHFSVRVLDDYPSARDYVWENFPDHFEDLEKRIAKRRRAKCFEYGRGWLEVGMFRASPSKGTCPEIFRPEYD